MEFFEDESKLFSNAKIGDLESLCPKGKRGKTQVTLVCYLAEQFQRRAKSGKLIASIKVDDGSASIEGIMFEKDILAHELPSSNTPVVVIGAVDMGYDGEQLRLSIERVYPISTIRAERIGELNIGIACDSEKGEISPELSSKLSALIKPP